MKIFTKIIALALITTAFVGFTLTSKASENSVSPEKSEHNDNKKRGRRGRDRSRDDDDSNSNSNSNRNSNSNSNSNNSVSGISASEARKIALKRISGTVVKEESEQKNGRWVYEFYIRQNDGETFEVYVDAENGGIVKVESRNR